MKKNKNLIWIVGGLALVAAGAFVWSQIAGADAQNEYTPNPYPALPPVGGSSASGGYTGSTGYASPPFGVNAGAYYGVGGGSSSTLPFDPMTYDPLAEFKPGGSTPSYPFGVHLGGPSTGLVTGIVAPGFTVGGAADEQPGFGVHYPGTLVF